MTTSPKRYPMQNAVTPRALVVYCSDHRFQAAFRQFVEEDLALQVGHYIPLIVGGGAGTFAHPQLEDEFSFVARRLSLHKQHSAELERIVMFTHEDCKYYPWIHAATGGHTDHLPKHDLATLHLDIDEPATPPEFAELIRTLGLSVELYCACLTEDDRNPITFEPMTV